jgi:nitronate monooxygenase
VTIPSSLRNLKLPAIAAPMFLVSGPDLVVETCRSGVIGTFPALNQRSSAGYEEWLEEITARAGADYAPFGVNLIVHKSNERLAADLALTVKHKVPLVITSLGAVKEVIDAVHSYGGLVFHDVINTVHGRKAAEAGVDGLIAVCAGAGGHAGTFSPFALVPELKQFFPGTVILSGAMSTGAHIAAARMLGADLAYLGTRFIATEESLATESQKRMILDLTAKDILYSPEISGINANFMLPSILNAGLDPATMKFKGKISLGDEEARVWRDIWSAGQGVGSITDIPRTAELCGRLIAEYRAALNGGSACGGAL